MKKAFMWLGLIIFVLFLSLLFPLIAWYFYNHSDDHGKYIWFIVALVFVWLDTLNRMINRITESIRTQKARNFVSSVSGLKY